MTISTPSVLVVDDDAGITSLVIEVLEEAGISAIGSSDPTDALRTIDSIPSLQVIVSDLMMPGMTGVEFIRTACTERPDIRVIFMSGGHPGLKFRKSDPFLPKPLETGMLLESIRSLADREDCARTDSRWDGPERRRQYGTCMD